VCQCIRELARPLVPVPANRNNKAPAQNTTEMALVLLGYRSVHQGGPLETHCYVHSLFKEIALLYEASCRQWLLSVQGTELPGPAHSPPYRSQPVDTRQVIRGWCSAADHSPSFVVSRPVCMYELCLRSLSQLTAPARKAPRA
jgi:hypothetical protein